MASSRVLLLAVVICLVKITSATPLSDLKDLEADFWAWRLEDSPEFASSLGVFDYNDRLRSFKLPLFTARNNKVKQYLQRLATVDKSALDTTAKIDYDILQDHLQTYVNGYTWWQYQPLNPVNFLEGVYNSPKLFIDILPFYSRGDFENYLERLSILPRQLDEYKDLMREAIRLGHTLNNVSVKTVPDEIDKLLVPDSSLSVFYTPFVTPLNKSDVSDTDQQNIRQRASAIISRLMAALQSLKDFLVKEYMPHTRTEWGVGSWDHGHKNYEACLRWHLSLDMTAQEVHDLGLKEVARIKVNMEKTLQQLGFSGTLVDFFNRVNNDPNNYFQTGDELLSTYKDMVFKRAFPKIDLIFKDIPKLPLRVEPSANDGPASYLGGTSDGSRPGVFYVPLFRPQEQRKMDMMSIALHETIPGHHLQSIYALSTDLPPYRKYIEDDNYYQPPFKFPFYTSYIEGWGLYAEYLGEELNLYKDGYELMGRYANEMFRASRLVIDTGLHAFSWDREQAIQYMINNTAFSRGEVEIEIDRYITWPGQACAYKIGELKIKELREKSRTALGAHFDVREFHSLVLDNGPVPLNILEQLVDDWIKKVGTPGSGPNIVGK